MKVYFERFLVCSCGRSERQTAFTLPMDWIAKALDKVQRDRFIKNKYHVCNNPIIKYTLWELKI